MTTEGKAYKYFTVMTPKPQATKPKIDNWVFTRLESFTHKKWLIAD